MAGARAWRVDRKRSRPRPPRLHGRTGEAVRETDTSLRTVPLPLRPRRRSTSYLRGSTPACCSRRAGGHLNLHEWRADEWTPGVRAAGLEHRSPYALRHTYATFAIAAGVSLFELARFMGTSVDQIDKTYGHLLPDALDRTRLALDAFTANERTAKGGQRQ